MKNKALIKSKEYRAFRRKIFVRSTVILLIAVIVIYLLRSVVFRGRFGDFIVSAFQNSFFMEFDAAYNLYYQLLRNNIDLIMIVSMMIAFLIIS